MLIWPNGVPSSSKKTSRRNATEPGNSVLCSLQAFSSAQPRPGDVYKPRGISGSTLRPLGLIPHRRRDGMWKELSLMLSALPNATEPSELSVWDGDEEGRSEYQPEEMPSKGSQECREVVKTKKFRSNEPRRRVGKSAGRGETSGVVFRRQEVHDVDLDYIDMLGNCSLHKYPSLNAEQATAGIRPLKPIPSILSGMVSNGQRQNMARFGDAHIKASLEKTKSLWKHPTVDLGYEYLSFTLPAHLSTRLQHTDLRDAQDYEPCERCRLRGTRCSRCKVIRTGGGYIILEPGSGDDIDGSHNQSGHGITGLRFDGYGGGRDGDGSGGLGFDGSSTTLKGIGRYGNQDGLGDHMLSDHSRGQTGLDHAQHGGLGMGGLFNTSGELGSRLGKKGSGQDGLESSSNTGLLGDGKGGRDADGDGKASRDRSARLGGKYRPGSSMRRPPSSFHRKGSKLDGRDRTLRNTDFERGGRHGRGQGGDGDSDDEDGSGHKKGGRRRRLTDDGDEDDADKKGRGLKSAKSRRRYHLGRDEDEFDQQEGSQFNLGNLRRFKSKRDNMRALKCTLKELQGIDPLDYLAKYCIIDQAKVPNYQRVFENVDRDEDDELTIPELDFALKAVNNNLISDAEMTYVHTILELAGRYALNFRLFCLVAALSEKVVSLEAMVKRLINDMDFKALEVKMKKCKELFYLLANSNDQEGVVTASDLAVELQAGGLTEEHVDFVVNRLNHEDRGIIEFLDYLTYVPLFVEIHDNISGNPLDFSRTR